MLCVLLADTSSETDEAVAKVRAQSYSRLHDVPVQLRTLHSDFVYFDSRFTLSSYFFGGHLHYIMRANPLAKDRGLPSQALEAILAHELAHIAYYGDRNRLRLIGLARLLSPGMRARFERKADLDAIALGYGPGLALYRTWLYANIPPRRIAAKKRDYFTPEEIGAIVEAVKRNPILMGRFAKVVPRDLAHVQALSR
jgi:hypothetical protein